MNRTVDLIMRQTAKKFHSFHFRSLNNQYLRSRSPNNSKILPQTDNIRYGNTQVYENEVLQEKKKRQPTAEKKEKEDYLREQSEEVAVLC